MNSLDTILSGREAASAQDKPQETETTQAATEQEAAAGPETEQQPEAEGAEPSKDGKAPIGAIRAAEREKATKRYTEQVADFDKRLAESNAAWERRFTQLLETVKPKEQPQAVPDIFENADGFVDHRITRAVNPEFQRINGVLLHNSMLIASQLHTEKAVSEADHAFAEAVQNRTIDPADYQRVMNSPNVYDAAVRWHRRQQALQEIGDDPAAYRERVRAEILAESQQAPQNGQQTGAGQQPAVMPSNLAAARNVGSRAGPAWAGPKPLNEIFKR